jgi:hypothetical protein
MGPAAFEGGLNTAMFGLILHVGVALAWTALFAVAYARAAGLRRTTRGTAGAVTVGAAYGTLVWLVMRLAVLPFVGARPNPVMSASFAAMLVVHIAFVGLAIALLVRDRQPDER